MTEAIEILDLDNYEPTDEEILSWLKMMQGPDQLLWEYDGSWAKVSRTPQKEVAEFRSRRARQRETNHPLWAMCGKRVVGMIGINRFADAPQQHCGEIGFGVTKEFTRRGIGEQLLRAAIAKARELGLKRLQADCFGDNAPSIALLIKCGFAEEGLRTGALCKDSKLRDQRLFGLVLCRSNGG